MGEYISSKEKTTWREIVLEHIRKILECSRTEFRGGFYFERGENPPIRVYVPDTRQTYMNAIDSLADVLLPFFDKGMKDDFKKITTEYEKILDNKLKERQQPLIKEWNLNLKLYKENPKTYSKPNRESFESKKKECEKFDLYEKNKITKKRLEIKRKLFQKLNLLLHRIDYLKSAIYSEGDDDVEDVD